MKKINFLCCLVGISLNIPLTAQQNPTGTPQGTLPPSVPNSSYSWFRGGNNNVGNGGSNNIFGTFWNSPIHTYTSSVGRMKLNGTLNYAVDAYNAIRDGFLFLGYSQTYSAPTYNGANSGAFSLLHLNGNEGTFIQDGGYRPWMRTGVTFTDNNDLSYMGIRKVGNGTDVTETTITWSDNAGSTFPGPDDCVFRFTSQGSGNTTISTTNLQTTNDLDGLHIARFTGDGNFGLGNTFGSNPAGTPAGLYVRPQSLEHLSLSNLRSVWQQFTNRNLTTASGTQEGASDGLRLGIIGSTNFDINGVAMLYNQENRHLLLSTNGNTNTVNLASGNTQERVRVTNYNTPTNLPTGGYGIYNPDPTNIPANQNISRVSISHNPVQPVTRPLSLLHLGYNTGAVSLTPAATDGWRSWMDIGMFTSNGTDNVYIGLKREPATPLNPNDRHDAVVSWGDNQAAGFPPAGPDNMRFIFTATQTGSPTTAPANGFDGLEGMRMTPTLNTGVFTGVGGAPTVNPYVGGGSNATNTLEVNSWGLVTNPGGSSGLRFTDLNTTSPTIPNPGPGVLAVDANGDVIYVDANTNTGIGNYCTAPTQNPLTGDYEIPLNNFSYNFTAQPNSNDLSRVNIGNLACGAGWPARLYVREAEPMPGAPFHTAITGETDGNLLPNFAPVFGTAGFLYNSRAVGFTNHAGVFGISISANNNFFGPQTMGIGVIGTAVQNDINVGVVGIATVVNANTNIGIYGEASGASAFNRAGYFNGILETTVPAIIPSDLNLKTNINQLENADSILNLILPKTFEYDISNTPQFNFPTGEQMGVIAQDVETVLPQLVKSSYRPANYDSLGNLIYNEIYYKSVDYEAFIPLLIAGHKEQSVQINEKDSLISLLEEENNTQDSLITSLQDQINTLYGMITACCSSNSNMGSSIQNQNTNQTLDITLNDAPSIVLDQNVPNPFAEQTTITYSLVDGVQKAQMLFYNIEGKLIQSVNLTPTCGKGQINVFANDLSTGVYTYTLVVDGEIKGTKRMVKE